MFSIIISNIFWVVLWVTTFFLCVKNTAFMLDLVREDYILENLTVFCYLLSSLFFALLLFSFWKKEKINFFSFCYKYKFYFFFLIFSFFVAGEELSWGERIFNISSSNTINRINLQNELNIHNIVVGDFDYDFQYKLIVLFFFINGVFIPLANLQPTIKNFLVRINFPVINLSLIMLFLGVVLSVKIWVNAFDIPIIISEEGKSSKDLITEYMEAFSGIGFFLYPFLIFLRTRKSFK